VPLGDAGRGEGSLELAGRGTAQQIGVAPGERAIRDSTLRHVFLTAEGLLVFPDGLRDVFM